MVEHEFVKQEIKSCEIYCLCEALMPLNTIKGVRQFMIA
ncbi:MAG: hypothetical protein ACJA2M_002323 [Polaribacter sp.]|jgi:hypothetical protein